MGASLALRADPKMIEEVARHSPRDAEIWALKPGARIEATQAAEAQAASAVLAPKVAKSAKPDSVTPGTGEKKTKALPPVRKPSLIPVSSATAEEKVQTSLRSSSLKRSVAKALQVKHAAEPRAAIASGSQAKKASSTAKERASEASGSQKNHVTKRKTQEEDTEKHSKETNVATSFKRRKIGRMAAASARRLKQHASSEETKSLRGIKITSVRKTAAASERERKQPSSKETKPLAGLKIRIGRLAAASARKRKHKVNGEETKPPGGLKGKSIGKTDAASVKKPRHDLKNEEKQKVPHAPRTQPKASKTPEEKKTRREEAKPTVAPKVKKIRKRTAASAKKSNRREDRPTAANAVAKLKMKVKKDNHSNILGSVQQITGLKPFKSTDPNTIPSRRMYFRQENPKTPKSDSYRRYERYKGAQSLKGFYKLGGTTVDLKNDVAKGYARFYAPVE